MFLLNIFLGFLCVAGILLTLLGMLTAYHVFIRTPKSPADNSNRINSFRLFWFAITKQEDFVEMYPWLKNDESENVEND